MYPPAPRPEAPATTVGAGAGGGIVSVLSRNPPALHQLASFRVGGAAGGVCSLCGRGWRRGGRTAIVRSQLRRGIRRYDNDFDVSWTTILGISQADSGAC
jgi:hypothetical protein